MAAQAHDFGEFRLLGPQGPLLRGGTQVKLQPKATAVLWTLLQRSGEVVTKAELLDAVWPNQDVGEEALSFQIKKLRQAMDDDAHDARYVTTVHRIGFRFVPVQDAAPPDAGESLFVGRESELQHLHTAAAEVRQGGQRALFITGEPGIGKTALIERFVQQQRELPAPLLIGAGQCQAQHQGREPYAVLIDALDKLLRQPGGSAHAEALKSIAPNWLLQLPGIFSRRELQALKPDAINVGRERMQREWLAAMANLAAEQPLLLVLEDLHWSDKSSLDLLTVMLRQSQPAPVLLVTSYRPVDAIVGQHPVKDFKQGLTGAGKALELPLAMFTAAEVASYLQRRMDAQTPERGLPARLHRRTDGHPLYLAQMVEAMSQPTAGAAPAADVLETVPHALQDLINTQIDQLTPGEQRLLERSSVAGSEFTAALVAAGVEQSPGEVESSCLAMAKSGRFIHNAGMAVWPDGTTTGRFRLRHELFRQVLQQRIPEVERAPLCARYAARLQQAYGARVASVAPQLAEYFAAAGRVPESVAFRLICAQLALAAGAPDEAVAQAAQADRQNAECADEPLRQRTDLALAIIRVYIVISQRGMGATEIDADTARIRVLLPKVEDTALHEQGLTLLWLIDYFHSRHAEAMTWAEQMEQLGQHTKTPAIECAGLAWRSLNAHMTGAHAQSVVSSEKAIDIALTHDWEPWSMSRAEPGCSAMTARALSLWAIGRPDAALTCGLESVARAELIGNPYMRSAMLGMALPNVYVLRREPDRLVDTCDQALPLCERYGHLHAMAWSNILKGIGLCMLGQTGPGLALLRNVIEALRQTGVLLALPAYYAHLAEQLLVVGDGEQAQLALASGFDVLKHTGERHWEMELWRVQGEYHRLAEDDATAAGRCYRRALQLAEQGGGLGYALRAATALARLKQAAGQPAAVAKVLRPVYARFTEGHDTADLLDAKRLLDTLS